MFAVADHHHPLEVHINGLQRVDIYILFLQLLDYHGHILLQDNHQRILVAVAHVHCVEEQLRHFPFKVVQFLHFPALERLKEQFRSIGERLHSVYGFYHIQVTVIHLRFAGLQDCYPCFVCRLALVRQHFCHLIQSPFVGNVQPAANQQQPD